MISDTESLPFSGDQFGHIEQMIPGDRPWKLNICTSNSYTLDPAMIAELRQTLYLWAALPMHNEQTYVQTTHGVPTLVARFDLHPGGDIIEIEVRPQGLGLTSMFNPFFADMLAKVQATWPDFTSVQTEDHAAIGCDDHLWLDQVPLGSEPSSGLLMVRNLTHDDTDASHLAHRAVAPVANEGDKSYGVDLGLWKQVTEFGQLPKDEAFALKPLAGAKSHHIELWRAVTSKDRMRNESTWSRIERTFGENPDGMWMQPFHMPPTVMIGEVPHYLMLRPYFGYNVVTDDWDYLGGQFVLDPTIKIHGGSATKFGALI